MDAPARLRRPPPNPRPDAEIVASALRSRRGRSREIAPSPRRRESDPRGPRRLPSRAAGRPNIESKSAALAKRHPGRRCAIAAWCNAARRSSSRCTVSSTLPRPRDPSRCARKASRTRDSCAAVSALSMSARVTSCRPRRQKSRPLAALGSTSTANARPPLAAHLRGGDRVGRPASREVDNSNRRAVTVSRAEDARRAQAVRGTPESRVEIRSMFAAALVSSADYAHHSVGLAGTRKIESRCARSRRCIQGGGR